MGGGVGQINEGGESGGDAAFGEKFRAWEFHDPFSLTPALSRWERKNC